MVNGIVGSNERYGDGEWLGWSGEDFEATIDLGKIQDINNISLRFYNGNGQWIYLPKKVIISSSSDGKTFTEIMARDIPTESTEKVVNLNLDFPKAKTQHLKIKAERYGVIEDGKQGAGHEAWLFVDELVVRSK